MNSKSLASRAGKAPLRSVSENEDPALAPKQKPDGSIWASLKKLRWLLGPHHSRRFLILNVTMILQAFLEAASLGGIPAFVAALSSPERVLEDPRVRP